MKIPLTEKNKLNITKELFGNLLIWYLIIIGIILLALTNFNTNHEQQFVYLAQAFLNGKPYFISHLPSWNDASFYNGYYYWPLGPFPAILLIPFVKLFGLSIHQGYLQFVLNAINIVLLYRIAKKITHSTNTSLWLSYGYIFASAYIGIALITWSWFFAHAAATTLILLALYEFFRNQRGALSGASPRWIITGIFIGLAIATRTSLVCTSLFFILSIARSKEKRSAKMKNLIWFFLPILIITISILYYNYIRFGSYFEQGYSYQLLQDKSLLASRNLGLWNIHHFPANIYYFLLKGPEAVVIAGTKTLSFPFIKSDPWGMSILLTSPLFLWCLRSPWKEKNVQHALSVALLTAFVVFGYYGIGFRQYGYRYALDFYPFLFIILAYSIKKIDTPFKAFILCSSLFNLYLVLSVFMK